MQAWLGRHLNYRRCISIHRVGRYWQALLLLGTVEQEIHGA